METKDVNPNRGFGRAMEKPAPKVETKDVAQPPATKAVTPPATKDAPSRE